MLNNKRQIIDIELVKSLMESKKINESELAKLMNITLPTIKDFLNGADQSRMSSIILYKLAVALNVKAHSLLHEEYR